MLLESAEHPASVFITLTYSEEHLPKDKCVSKRSLQLFLKRLVNAQSGKKLRYFAVGEYGSQTQRPHYHCILFGWTMMSGPIIQKCWPFGYVHVGEANRASMRYLSGYVLKGMTRKDDRRLNGRQPEFTFQSRKPGLGFGVVSRIIKSYGNPVAKSKAETLTGIVPTDVRMEGRKYKIGRYLRNAVLAGMGYGETEKAAANIRITDQAFNERSGKTLRELQIRRQAKVDQQEGKFIYHKKRETL